MIKRNMVLVVAGAALTSFTAQATSVFEGFYAGAKVGYESSNYKDINPLDGNFGTSGADGIGGGLFFGYRQMIDAACLGLEVSAKLAGDKQSDKGQATISVNGVSQTVQASSSTKRDYVLGVHALIGGLLAPKAFGFVKLGGNYTCYKFSESIPAGSEAPITGKKKKFAFNAGIGTELQIADALTLRTEWDYTPAATIDEGVKASHSSFSVGLVYKVN